MASIAPTITNGVNVTQLVETVNAIKANPSLAKFRFRAATKWEGGGRCTTEIGTFYGAGQETPRSRTHRIEGDEPPVLLGSDRAANAVEAVLHALAACVSVGMAYNAAARGIEIEELSFRAEGDLDLHAFLGLSDAVRPGFEGIRFTTQIKAKNASRKQLEDLCEYVQKTSPVLDIVRNPVPVKVVLETA